jgi:hypothetical protein|eukprot:SAG25_NODE_7_length_29214_cov_40.245818_5_plen_74_part_00
MAQWSSQWFHSCACTGFSITTSVGSCVHMGRQSLGKDFSSIRVFCQRIFHNGTATSIRLGRGKMDNWWRHGGG